MRVFRHMVSWALIGAVLASLGACGGGSSTTAAPQPGASGVKGVSMPGNVSVVTATKN